MHLVGVKEERWACGQVRAAGDVAGAGCHVPHPHARADSRGVQQRLGRPPGDRTEKAVVFIGNLRPALDLEPDKRFDINGLGPWLTTLLRYSHESRSHSGAAMGVQLLGRLAGVPPVGDADGARLKQPLSC